MAASITNSNETLATGLLIHEVGFFLPPPLKGLQFHMAFFFPYSPWFLIYFVASHFHSSYFIVIFEIKEHHSV